MFLSIGMIHLTDMKCDHMITECQLVVIPERAIPLWEFRMSLGLKGGRWGGGEKTSPHTAALSISPSNYHVKLSPTGLRIDYQAVGPAVCCSKQIEKLYHVP